MTLYSKISAWAENFGGMCGLNCEYYGCRHLKFGAFVLCASSGRMRRTYVHPEAVVWRAIRAGTSVSLCHVSWQRGTLCHAVNTVTGPITDCHRKTRSRICIICKIYYYGPRTISGGIFSASKCYFVPKRTNCAEKWGYAARWNFKMFFELSGIIAVLLVPNTIQILQLNTSKHLKISSICANIYGVFWNNRMIFIISLLWQ